MIPPQGAAMGEFRKSLVDFIIVTIPGLLLYFLGWVYLSYYLSQFQINPSELKLDFSTIFTYSYIPIYNTIGGGLLLVSLAVLVFVIMLFTIFTNIYDIIVDKTLYLWYWIWGLLTRRVKWLQYRPISRFNSTCQTVYFTIIWLLVLIVFLNLALVRFARWTAAQAVNDRWNTPGQRVAVVLTESEPKFTIGTLPDISEETQITRTVPVTDWVDNLTKCENRFALVPIIADDSTSFFLCKSSERDISENLIDEGDIYEITKEKGLVLSRHVSKGETK
jgi:hypothetical protein